MDDVKNEIEIDLKSRYIEEVYQAQKEQSGLATRLKRFFMRPSVLGTIVGLTTIGIPITLGTLEGISKGMSLLVAIKYGFAVAFVTKTSKVIDPLIVQGPFVEFISDWFPKVLLEMRRIVIDGLALGGVISALSAWRKLDEHKKQNILNGKSAIKRTGEELYLLVGEGSAVAESLFKELPHNMVLPIFESADGASGIRHLIQANQTDVAINKHGEPQEPFFVNLEISDNVDYYQTDGFNRIDFRHHNLLKADTGEQILLVYGLGDTRNEILPLADEQKQDVTVAELVEATRRMKEVAEKNGVKVDKVVTVYLGNANHSLNTHTGTGHSVLTEREAAKHSIDIFVDTRSPIINEVIKVLNGKNIFAFDTSRIDYAHNLAKSATAYNIKLYDVENPVHKPEESVCIVYHEDTTETLLRAENLKDKYELVVVLSPSSEAHDRAEKEGFLSICIPVVYSKIFFKVRRRIRQGMTVSEIQEYLDEKYPWIISNIS